MYFLESISGLTGEELVSAILKHLLVHSDVLRHEFLGLGEIKRQFPSSRPPSFRHGVLCFLEYGTKSQTFGEGKIDILIQADNCLFGVENKLWAEIQPNQPIKYRESLEEESARLFGTSDAYKFVLLFPEDRGSPNGDVEPALSSQGLLGNCVLLTWEKMLSSCIEPVITSDSRDNAVVASSLKEYIQFHLGSQVIDIPASNLVGRSVIVGNEFQWDLLYRLRDIFPNASKMGSGRLHAGFYFRFEEDEPQKWNWFGFLKEDNAPVELVVQSYLADFDASSLSHYTKTPQIRDKSQHTIDFPPETKTITEWRNLLNPVLDQLRAIEQANP